jgi:hypothetical protein
MEAKHPSSDYHARVKSGANEARYSDIHIEGGKTHLGDAYYFGKSPQCSTCGTTLIVVQA